MQGKLFDWMLPSTTPLRWLAIGNLVNMTGSGITLSVLVVYLAELRHLSLGESATVLTVSGLVGVLGAAPAGILCDRHGPRRTAVLTELACAAALVLIATVASFWAVAGALAARQLAVSANTTARVTLMGRLVPAAERVRLRAYQRTVTNVGFAAGTLVGGLAAADGSAAALTTALVIDAATFCFGAFATSRLPEVRSPPSLEAKESRRAVVLRDPSYLAAAVLNGLHTLGIAVAAIGVPLWIVYSSPLPSWAVSVAPGMNTVLLVLLQVPLSRFASDVASAGRSLVVAGALIAVACAGFALDRAAPHDVVWPIFLTVCLLLAIGEVLGATAGWTLSYDLAPDHLLGRYQGVWQLVADGAAKAVGPALIGLAAAAGPVGWLALGGGFAGLSSVSAPTVRWAVRKAGRPTA